MRIALSILGLSILAMPTLSAINLNVLVKQKLEKSVVQLADNCSGFVINEEADYLLTAKHCGFDDPEKVLIVDLLPGKVVASDIKEDLMVLQVPGLDKPQLELSERELVYGEEIYSFGYGYGLKTPMLRRAMVAQPKAIIPEIGGETWVMTDAAIVPGQSGSPWVNEQGEIVAILQMTTDRVGLGRSAAVLKDRVGRWFGKKKAPKAP